MHKFKVLAIDGGGIRGAFAAGFLAELEQHIPTKIYEHFDLVAGTSTGGIIAMALALGMSARQVREFYERHGKQIFSRGQRSLLGPAFAAKYSGSELENALRQAFGEQRLADAKVRLIIPAVNLITGQPTTFKTPHLRAARTRDSKYSAVDVVLATTAAPTYFNRAKVAGEGSYCDGGLWANNPSLVGYTEAMRIRDEAQADTGVAPFSERDVSILSIGTGKQAFSFEPPANAGYSWWARGMRLLDVILNSQAQGTAYITGFLADRETYRRIDFDLPERSWTLDNARVLERYLHIGKETAQRHLYDLQPLFFKALAAPFTPGSN